MLHRETRVALASIPNGYGGSNALSPRRDDMRSKSWGSFAGYLVRAGRHL
jgi:hypothetical protein